MHAVSQTFILNLTPQMIRYRQRVEDFVSCSSNCRHFCLSLKHRHGAMRIFNREQSKCLRTAAVLSGAETSSTRFEEFSVSTADTNDVGELKLSFEVFGNKTQRTFDYVFQKMVEAAQPIPGFRRVKGGKTPNIPKDILLEVLGPSNVFKQVIEEIINSTVAEYVEKESLNVKSNLRVEQSLEDLETTFEEGETFNFDVVLQLQK
ncbi:unnamed protein product [Trifolium pratense]|uniref:Uncharacterized protein n=1 Tax=Trifolium pratense TaxID=57577 RepID=A0ACB0J4A8_TRIPR|nr:unnamed protein product [Trifolium pratense]